MKRKLCICISPAPQRSIEVRLHTLLTLALDSNERSVPRSGNFIIYYVQFLMGSDCPNKMQDFFFVNNEQKFIHQPSRLQVKALDLIEFMYFYPQKVKFVVTQRI